MSDYDREAALSKIADAIASRDARLLHLLSIEFPELAEYIEQLVEESKSRPAKRQSSAPADKE